MADIVGHLGDDPRLRADGLSPLAAKERADFAYFYGDVRWINALFVYEGQDTANFEGEVGWRNHLAAQEGKDVAKFEGTVQWPVPSPRLPTIKDQVVEIKKMLVRMVDAVLLGAVTTGTEAAALRQYCGNLLVRFDDYLYMGQVSVPLLAVFRSATDTGMGLNGMDLVLDSLFAETPTVGWPRLVQQTAIIFGLTQEARIIQKMEFVSRDDVDLTMTRLRELFERARDIAADEIESSAYESLMALHAALFRYLADTARPLPRMVNYELAPQPALSAANFIYGDGSRWEEIVDENHIIHPAFCPHDLRALSA
jgi:hypothetical protein